MDTAGHCLMCDGPKPITTLLAMPVPYQVLTPTMQLRWNGDTLEQCFIGAMVGYGGQTEEVWRAIPRI